MAAQPFLIISTFALLTLLPPAVCWGADAVAAVAPDPLPIKIEAADGVVLSADLYPSPVATSAPLAILFHQAGSNAAEYAPIAPRLVELGYNALAVDCRSGGYGWGRNNRTVVALGRSTDFHAAYRDLEAAVAWATGKGYRRPLIVWGSSYTAALVMRLAAEHSQVGGVLSFSPGEYLGPGEPVRDWTSRVRVPVFVTSAPGPEVEVARRILEPSPSPRKVQFVPDVGTHGSSTLRDDRNPGGTAENWAAVEKFLSAFTIEAISEDPQVQ